MPIVEIRIGVSRSINLGNYENAKLEDGLTVGINEGDDVEAIKASLLPELRGLLETAWRAQQKPKPDPSPPAEGAKP